MHRTQSLITLGAGLLALSVLSSGAAAQSATSAPPPDGSSGEDEPRWPRSCRTQSVISTAFPFQNNTNFNTGPNKGTQDILNVQPVIPIHINDDWNVITRTILPLVWNPSLQPAQSCAVRPLRRPAFPHSSRRINPVDGWVWGVGPIVQSCRRSPTRRWAPMCGVSVRRQWSSSSPVRSLPARWSTTCSHFGGTPAPGGTRYSLFTLNPFFNYNFGEGWYVGSSSIITANWQTSGNMPDSSSWCRHRPRDQDRRQAAGKFADRRLLQRAAPAIWFDVAATHASNTDLLIAQS